MIPYNKVCNYEDFADPDLIEIMRDVFQHELEQFPTLPTDVEYRKHWEIAMAIRALRDHGVLHEDAVILGVGAGTETTIFYLTNYVKQVVATDLYLDPGIWGQFAPGFMLTEPEKVAPYPFKKDRLVAEHMSGTDLTYPNDLFDGIFSSGSIEHFGDWTDIALSAYEMGRVLKPGGVLTLSTEFLIEGPAGGVGFPGMRFFSIENLQRYIVEASGLDLVDPIDTSLSKRTLNSAYDLVKYSEDRQAQIPENLDYPRINDVVWSNYPHLVIKHEGYRFCSVHLTLKKTDHYPVTDNTWARYGDERPSVNIVGDLHCDTGLCEVTRNLTDALVANRVDVHLKTVRYPDVEENPLDARYERLTVPFGDQPTLLFYNFNILGRHSDKELAALTGGQYTIGPWYWEMPEIPSAIHGQFGRVDEIWAASRYVGDIFDAVSPNPVYVMPPPVKVETSETISRAAFGIPEDTFVFLFNFSAHSSDLRKNPLGLIKAFRQAFGKDVNGPLLVLKTYDLYRWPEFQKAIREGLETVNGHLIEDSLTRIEMNDLMACADCYVSLHRAEGFGLGMAEAMYLGKPVIGTYYSANVDYMTEANSYPVDFTLRPIEAADHKLQPDLEGSYAVGQIVAEPDLDHAARLMRQVYENPADARAIGEQAAYDIRRYCSPEIISKQVVTRIREIEAGGFVGEPALNLIGDISGDFGLIEATRKLLNAMLDADIDVSYVNYDYAFGRKVADLPERYRTLPQGIIYPVNLLTNNFREVAYFLDETSYRDLTGGKYTIGNWYWELTEIPSDTIKAFDFIDEIWVASNFVRETMAKVTDKPIMVIPPPVEVHTSGEASRKAFGLPEDRFIFFFSFGATSGYSRKNPEALVEAFKKAFGKPDQGGPVLVIKAHHIDLFPDALQSLQTKLDEVGGILIQSSFTRQEMNDLLTCIDVYVSLHRGEGFGLGMAEAMYLGKPVIGTNYSSNTDFMNEANSYPVDYRLRAVRRQDHKFQPDYTELYRPGSLWAEPDTDHAARLMREVFENPTAAQQKGQQAAADIHRDYSNETVGRLIYKRLRKIDPSVRRSSVPEGPVSSGNRAVLERESRMQHNERHQHAGHNRHLLHEWNELRLRDVNRIFHRVPILNFIVKTLVRIRNLGRIWGVESELYRTLLEQNDQMNSVLDYVGERLTYLETENKQLTHQLTQELTHKLTQLETNHAESMNLARHLEHQLITPVELPAFFETDPTTPEFEKVDSLRHLTNMTNLEDVSEEDRFGYIQQEAFRGSEALILQRQTKFLDYLKVPDENRQYPFLDVGCGRGEFLRLLTQHGLQAVGVDTSPFNIERLRNEGRDVHREDALTFLEQHADTTFAGISAFHFVEHVPHGYLLGFLRTAYARLAPGGCVLLQTPNPLTPESMYTFYHDPTHQHPLPPPLLALYLRSTGFEDLKAIYTSPVISYGERAAATRIDRYMDYAIVAFKGH